MPEMSDYIPFNFISMFILGALLLRRLVRMEGHHWARVLILTVMLWVPAVYLFLSALGSEPDYYRDCTPTDYERHVFCISEY